MRTLENLRNIGVDIARAKAMKEQNPSKRCQELGWVIRIAPASKFRDILSKALKAAAESDDLYLATYPLAWPIKALLERDEPELATPVLAKAIEQSKKITPTASQAVALFTLLQSVFDHAELREATFLEYRRASIPSFHWRVERCYAFAALMFATLDIDRARHMATDIAEGRVKRQLFRRLEAQDYCKTREFFW